MGESGQKCDYMRKDEFLNMVIGTVNFVGQIEFLAEFWFWKAPFKTSKNKT